MRHQGKSLEQLQSQCGEWNAFYPPGTDVIVRMDSGELRPTKTRSRAEVLSGHTPVIWLEGISGAYLLDRVYVEVAAR